MTCPNCGWYVRGGGRFCPNCGAELPTDVVRSCSQCRIEVKGRVSLCPRCGGLLDDGPLPAAAETSDAPAEPPPRPEAPESEPDSPRRKCPNCKTELKGKVGICPVCGEWAGGSRPAPESTGRTMRPLPADWPFKDPPPADERPVASKMRPLSPNWPFDEVEPVKKDRRAGKKRSRAKAKPKAEAAEAKPKAAEPAEPAAPPSAVRERPEARPAEPRPAADDRPPKAWSMRGRPEEWTLPDRRPAAQAKPAPSRKAGAPARSWLALLPWFGLLLGLVLASIVVYGFATGSLSLPRLGGQPEDQPTPAATGIVGSTPTVMVIETSLPAPTETRPPTETPAPLTHVVETGESLLSIAEKYGITVTELIEANELTEADVLRVGQELKIPGSAAETGPEETAAPTSEAAETPTGEATEPEPEETPEPEATEPGPGETPTAGPAPTAVYEFAAPNLLNPPDGAVFEGAEDILLNWSSVGLLGDDTWYVVRVWSDDPDLPAIADGWTRTTHWRIPASSQPPANAASHTFHWTVTVMRAREGQEPTAISPTSATRTFEWH